MTSLSITDLTSDGEYSVTVAGRDGAGRLGQESEELSFRNSIHYVLFGYNVQQNCVIVQWKVSVAIIHSNSVLLSINSTHVFLK